MVLKPNAGKNDSVADMACGIVGESGTIKGNSTSKAANSVDKGCACNKNDSGADMACGIAGDRGRASNEIKAKSQDSRAGSLDKGCACNKVGSDADMTCISIMESGALVREPIAIKASCNMLIEGELDELIRMFSPYLSLAEVPTLNLDILPIDDGVEFVITDQNGESTRFLEGEWSWDKVKGRAEIKKIAKVMLYDYLSDAAGAKLPYGSLTGIRPTKLYHELQARGMDAKAYFEDTLRVSPHATDWVGSIVANQHGLYNKCDDEIDIFVNIPICVTRCSYCSFISAELGRIKRLVPKYVSQLRREIEHTLGVIKQNGYCPRSIYVGGGTPTSLSAEDLGTVLSPLKVLKGIEFTVEAGRPDTISREKLSVMENCGVTRISINPQTFDEQSLKLIGRSHSSQDIYNVYAMAREFSMDINMDLIAMLPGESLETFQKSVLKAIELKPDNITVHTLAIKRGSGLKLTNHDNTEGDAAEKMLDFSKKVLTNSGYKPYYMYRQKYMSGNLENTGYALADKACKYNIDIMEETHSIIACGAGGISKRVFGREDRLERLSNPKGIDIYLEREEIIAADKEKFFTKE